MDTRHITYFMAVFNHLHFTKAAEELGISQPTLSQQIRLLEAEVGMPLFDRIGKSRGHRSWFAALSIWHENASS